MGVYAVTGSASGMGRAVAERQPRYTGRQVWNRQRSDQDR